MKKVLALALALCMIFALAAAGTAYADFKPDGPVTMIVAYKAGSGTDNTARILAKYAEKYVGQTIVIDNAEGGSGSIGWSKLADSDPDGLTIGFINLPNFSSSIVNEMGTYTVESFAPICNHVTETSTIWRLPHNLPQSHPHDDMRIQDYTVPWQILALHFA